MVNKFGFDCDVFAQKLDLLNTQIPAKLDNVHKICTETVEHIQQVRSKTVDQTVSTANDQCVHPSADTHDKSMNVVLFGVEEDKDFNKWRGKVDNALQLIAGRTVAISHIFRWNVTMRVRRDPS